MQRIWFKNEEGMNTKFHLYFDDLFPNSLGKPIVNWWN